MEYLFWLGFWCIVSYFVAKKTKEQCPGLDVNPVNYVIGAILIGAIFCLPYLFYKKHKYLQNKVK